LQEVNITIAIGACQITYGYTSPTSPIESIDMAYKESMPMYNLFSPFFALLC